MAGFEIMAIQSLRSLIFWDNAFTLVVTATRATLLVESFAGTNFRDFANFLVVRESLYPHNRSV